MFKMVYENGKIFPVFNEEQFHQNEKNQTAIFPIVNKNKAGR